MRCGTVSRNRPCDKIDPSISPRKLINRSRKVSDSGGCLRRKRDTACIGTIKPCRIHIRIAMLHISNLLPIRTPREINDMSLAADKNSDLSCGDMHHAQTTILLLFAPDLCIVFLLLPSNLLVRVLIFTGIRNRMAVGTPFEHPNMPLIFSWSNRVCFTPTQRHHIDSRPAARLGPVRPECNRRAIGGPLRLLIIEEARCQLGGAFFFADVGDPDG